MSAARALNVIHIAEFNTTSDVDRNADMRRAIRRRVLKGAIVAFNNRHCTVACTVRDISATGARLRSDGSVNMPDTFELLIELDGVEADCEVVWRKGNEVGVRFKGAPRRTIPKRRQALSVSLPDRGGSLRRNRRPVDETER